MIVYSWCLTVWRRVAVHHSTEGYFIALTSVLSSKLDYIIHLVCRTGSPLVSYILPYDRSHRLKHVSVYCTANQYVRLSGTKIDTGGVEGCDSGFADLPHPIHWAIYPQHARKLRSKLWNNYMLRLRSQLIIH